MVIVETIRTSEMISHNEMFMVNEIKKPPPLLADGGPTTLSPPDMADRSLRTS
jgi:hypothetical protein